MCNLVLSLLPDITIAALGASGSDSKGEDPDKINDPVITASPMKGNGVVDIPDNCDPSPIYVPKDAVEDALDEKWEDAVIGELPTKVKDWPTESIIIYVLLLCPSTSPICTSVPPSASSAVLLSPAWYEI